MGAAISRLKEKLFSKREARVLMLGLDAAGKTTILYNLKGEAEVTTIPTVGFNVETVVFRKTKFNVWDVGGQDKIRSLWRHYLSGSEALIFVIDSSDRARIDEAKNEMLRVINDREMADASLLVFANKQDLPNAMTPAEIKDILELDVIGKTHDYSIQPAVATNGEGIVEGLTWLDNILSKKGKNKDLPADGMAS